MRYLILLLFYSHVASAKLLFPAFKVGCLSSVNELMKLECSEETMSFEVLKTHYKSHLPNAKTDLENAIFIRAKYFLEKKEYDYFSVLMIMAFPVPDKEKWLKEFQKIPGKRAPFSLIAMERIQGKQSEYCLGKKVPLYLKEICDFEIFK
jgi:hypothetical protein